MNDLAKVTTEFLDQESRAGFTYAMRGPPGGDPELVVEQAGGGAAGNPVDAHNRLVKFLADRASSQTHAAVTAEIIRQVSAP